jgi:transposase
MWRESIPVTTAKRGSAQQGRPLIQIGLGVTQDEGIPVFHKTFDGNIADARTL